MPVWEDNKPLTIPIDASASYIRLEFEPINADAVVRTSRISAIGCKKPPVGKQYFHKDFIFFLFKKCLL